MAGLGESSEQLHLCVYFELRDALIVCVTYINKYFYNHWVRRILRWNGRYWQTYYPEDNLCYHILNPRKIK